MAIDGLDAFTCVSSARPQMTFDEIEINFINQKRYLSGKMSYQTMNLVLNDPIAPSAAQKVMQWIMLNYEVLTGRAGYASFYKKDIALKMLDPVGNVVEKWTITGAWIQDCNFDDLDYTNQDPAQITLSLRYDSALIEY